MSAISFMIPLVIVGGLLMAIPSAIAANGDRSGTNAQSTNSFTEALMSFGKIGLTLMVPVVSMIVAYKLGGKPAIPGALIGGFFINDGPLMGKFSLITLPPEISGDASAGFFGGLLVGIFIGYLVRWMQWIQWHRFVKPISQLMIVPIISSFITYLFILYVVGSPMTWLMSQIYSGLSRIETEGIWISMLIGMLFAAMMSIDLGGPINKTAYSIATIIFADTISGPNPNFVPFTAMKAAICVPPLGMWLATLLFRKKFSKAEHTAGAAAFGMGLVGISEGALPFAFRTPLKAIAANVTGSALAGALVSLFQIRLFAGMGSPLDAYIGYQENSFYGLLWIASILVGVITTAVLYGLMRKRVSEYEIAHLATKRAKLAKHVQAGRLTKKARTSYVFMHMGSTFKRGFVHNINPKNWVKRPDNWGSNTDTNSEELI